ncbi:SRPBCC family protein [Arthrobacter roseus]|uniref:SRPBCC family protein n=1 Tax=Arthrobacter roseus TaxID=136274 RepID=UPI0019652308|nr:SRPBCC family protein [Arthrobacter roseus]MBM7847404.1 carbon monoxide dehydrogenase subunit G [Arthrobacter roseus]
MTIAFETEETVNAARTDVWARFTDWTRAQQWLPGVSSVSADGETTDGTILRFNSEHHPHGEGATAILHDVVPFQKLTLTTVSGDVSADYRYSFTGTGNATRILLVADVAVTGDSESLAESIRERIANAERQQLALLKKAIETEIR